jgi:rhodanese-related sulfurtransferase
MVADMPSGKLIILNNKERIDMVRRIALICCLLLVTVALAYGEGPVPKDEKKHTTIGKYVTAAEAYEVWKANPDKVKILDVRTPEEYAFVGHAPMAHNVPSKLWTGKYSAEKKDYVLEDNPEFEAQLKKQFGVQDVILAMCRSGHRSAAAINRMAKAGFINVYNIVDGYEGDKIMDEESYFQGKRMTNGWKNSPAPWTYDLDQALIFAP